MDAQLTRPHDHHHHQHEPDLHHHGGIRTGLEEGHAHEGEAHPHGVKGVLKKVKRKAKKVKESLTGHGGHHHEDDRDHLRDVPDDHDLDEEDDDEDEEIVEDPAVHGASGHEAAVTAGLASWNAGSSAAMPHGYSGGGDPMKMSPMEAEQNRAGGRGLGGHHKLTDITEEPRAPFSSPMTRGVGQHPKDGDHQIPARPTFDAPMMTKDHHPKGGDQIRATSTFDTPMMATDQHPKGGDQTRATSTLMTTDQHPKGGDQFRDRSKFDTPTTLQRTEGGNERARSFVGQQEKDRGHLQVTFDEPLEEDPNGPKDRFSGRRSPSNYQSKTVDRSGRGGETKRSSTPWEEDLSNRNRATASVLPTGSHDQFSPEATRPRPISTFDGPKHGDKLQDHDHHHGSTYSPQNQSSSYTGKFSSAASALAGTAVSAKDAVASKLGYGGEERRNEGEKFQIYDPADDDHHRHHPTADQSTYTDKISSATSAIAGTAASAKNVVASKLGYGGGGNRNDDQTRVHNPADRSTIDRPQDQNQSSYTDKISSAASAVAGTAANAKNAVASKLGYGSGERNEDNQSRIHNPTAGEDQYGHRSTIDQPPQNQSSYTDKISSATSAITGTAASAKNVVASKLGYGGGTKDDDQTHVHNPTAGEARHHSAIKHPPTDKIYDVGERNSNQTRINNPQQNQSSYTDKISSAASAIVGTAASAKNVVASKLGYGSHEQEASEGEPRKKPMGVVTESEEVKRRLGSGARNEEDMEVEDSSVSVPATRGVIGRMVKGTVESWFGKGDNNNGGHDRDQSSVDHRRPSSGQTIGSSTGTEGLTESGNAAGGRVLQESGN
ncbi:Low-temperature-induced 65 kDa protein [Linum grandiflorum]